MSQRNEYDGELTASRAEIASILNGVADGLRAGSVRLGDDADAVSVDTPEELTLEIELEIEDDEASLELELEWPVSSDASPVSSADVVTDNTAEATTTSTSDDESEEVTDEEPALAGATDGSQSLAQFEVYQARDAEWRWRLRHRNGNIIATSGEGYTRKHNAMKGLRSVIANSTDAAIDDRGIGHNH